MFFLSFEFFSTLFAFSMLIVLIPCCLVLEKNRGELYFRKRGLTLLRSYLYVSGFNQIILLPLRAAATSWSESHLGGFFYIFYYSAVFCSTIALSILICRVLLQWVNIRRSEDSCDWKHQIDPDYRNISWVLRYYHIIGNPTNLLYILLCLIFIEVVFAIFIILTVGLPYNQENFQIANYYINIILFGAWIVRFIVLLLCFRKLKMFMDYYYIRDELKCMAIVLLSCMCVGMIGIYLGPSIRWKHSTSVTTFTNTIWQTSSWYLSTIWVKKKNDDKNSDAKKTRFRSESSTATENETAKKEKRLDSNHNHKESKTNKLRDLIQTDKGTFLLQLYKHLQNRSVTD